MDGLTDKIAELLNDPQGLETVKSIAASLMGEAGGSKPTPTAPDAAAPPISAEQMSMLVKAMGMLGSGGEDDKTRLLLSLRPHLSEQRQQKADNAIKIMKIIRLLPLLTESGIFSML